MQDLKITIIQTELVWEDIESNLAAFDDKIDAVEDDTHLIVLPEMFTTAPMPQASCSRRTSYKP